MSRALARVLPLALLAAISLLAPANAELPRTIFVVRHADKPNDHDDALSELGAERARALAERLIGEHVERVIASEKARTQATASPLLEASHRLGRRVTRCTASEPDEIVAAIGRTRARTILVVTHSDAIDEVVEKLSGVSRVREPCTCEYDRLYRVELGGDVADGRSRLRLETFGARPLGATGEACSAASAIAKKTCDTHPESPPAKPEPIGLRWEAC